MRQMLRCKRADRDQGTNYYLRYPEEPLQVLHVGKASDGTKH